VDNDEDDNAHSLPEQPVHDISYMPDYFMRSLHQGVLNSKDENSSERFDMLLNISYNTLLIGLVLLDTGCRYEIFIVSDAPMMQTQVTHSHHPWFSLIL